MMHRKKRDKKKMGTMDAILLLLGIFTVLFCVAMVRIFLVTGVEMSTLETCVFGAAFGECGILGYIKGQKIKKGSEPEKPKDCPDAPEPEAHL